MSGPFLTKCLSELKAKLNQVLHLGAEWAPEYDTYEKFGANTAYWVEAIPHNKNIAYANFLCHSKMRNIWIDCAIADKDYKMYDFHIYNHPAASSLFKPKDMTQFYPGHKIESTIKVIGYTLDTITSLWGINPNALTMLSMDIQGAELLAIQHGKTIFSSPSLKYICAEVVWADLYDGGCVRKEIDEALTSYGFKEFKFAQHEPTYADIKEVPQADIFYVRS